MDTKYDRKFEELKTNLPFLECIIKRLENLCNLPPRQAKLDKIKSLRDLLLDKDKSTNYNDLLKHEQYIVNLHAEFGQRNPGPDDEALDKKATEKSDFERVRKKFNSLILKEKSAREKTPEIARPDSVTGEDCAPGNKEPSLFQRRPNTPSIVSSPFSPTRNKEFKRNYTRVLRTPETSYKRWTNTEKISDRPFFRRKSPKKITRVVSPTYYKKTGKNGLKNKEIEELSAIKRAANKRLYGSLVTMDKKKLTSETIVSDNNEKNNKHTSKKTRNTSPDVKTIYKVSNDSNVADKNIKSEFQSKLDNQNEKSNMKRISTSNTSTKKNTIAINDGLRKSKRKLNPENPTSFCKKQKPNDGIPLLEATENVSENDISQDLKKGILNATTSVHGSFTPPLPEPKITKVVNAEEKGTNRIFVESYKDKSNTSTKSKTSKDNTSNVTNNDVIRKQSMKLIEKESKVYTKDSISKVNILGPGYGVKNYEVPEIKRAQGEKDINPCNDGQSKNIKDNKIVYHSENLVSDLVIDNTNALKTLNHDIDSAKSVDNKNDDLITKPLNPVKDTLITSHDKADHKNAKKIIEIASGSPAGLVNKIKWTMDSEIKEDDNEDLKIGNKRSSEIKPPEGVLTESYNIVNGLDASHCSNEAIVSTSNVTSTHNTTEILNMELSESSSSHITSAEIESISKFLFLLQDKSKIKELIGLIGDSSGNKKIKKKLEKLSEISSDDEDTISENNSKILNDEKNNSNNITDNQNDQPLCDEIKKDEKSNINSFQSEITNNENIGDDSDSVQKYQEKIKTMCENTLLKQSHCNQIVVENSQINIESNERNTTNTANLKEELVNLNKISKNIKQKSYRSTLEIVTTGSGSKNTACSDHDYAKKSNKSDTELLEPQEMETGGQNTKEEKESYHNINRKGLKNQNEDQIVKVPKSCSIQSNITFENYNTSEISNFDTKFNTSEVPIFEEVISEPNAPENDSDNVCNENLTALTSNIDVPPLSVSGSGSKNTACSDHNYAKKSNKSDTELLEPQEMETGGQNTKIKNYKLNTAKNQKKITSTKSVPTEKKRLMSSDVSSFAENSDVINDTTEESYHNINRKGLKNQNEDQIVEVPKFCSVQSNITIENYNTNEISNFDTKFNTSEVPIFEEVISEANAPENDSDNVCNENLTALMSNIDVPPLSELISQTLPSSQPTEKNNSNNITDNQNDQPLCDEIKKEDKSDTNSFQSEIINNERQNTKIKNYKLNTAKNQKKITSTKSVPTEKKRLMSSDVSSFAENSDVINDTTEESYHNINRKGLKNQNEDQIVEVPKFCSVQSNITFENYNTNEISNFDTKFNTSEVPIFEEVISKPNAPENDSDNVCNENLTALTSNIDVPPLSVSGSGSKNTACSDHNYAKKSNKSDTELLAPQEMETGGQNTKEEKESYHNINRKGLKNQNEDQIVKVPKSCSVQSNITFENYNTNEISNFDTKFKTSEVPIFEEVISEPNAPENDSDNVCIENLTATTSNNVPPLSELISQTPPSLQPTEENNFRLSVIVKVESLTSEIEQSSPSQSYPSREQTINKKLSKYEEIQAKTMSKKHSAVLNLMMSNIKLAHVFKCAGRYCFFTTDIINDALTHVSTHVRVGGVDCLNCVYCDYDACYDAVDLVTHIFKIHGPCPYVCNLCFYRAATALLVDAHIKRVHENKTNHQILHTSFRIGPNTEEQILSREEAVQIYNCTVGRGTDAACKYKTYTAERYSDHFSWKHESETNFFCWTCPMKFSTSSNLVTHMKIHGLKLYQCAWCARGCDNKAELLAHSSSNHPDKAPKAYLRIITRKEGTLCKVLPFALFNETAIASVEVASENLNENPVQAAETSAEWENAIHYYLK